MQAFCLGNRPHLCMPVGSRAWAAATQACVLANGCQIRIPALAYARDSPIMSTYVYVVLVLWCVRRADVRCQDWGEHVCPIWLNMSKHCWFGLFWCFLCWRSAYQYYLSCAYQYYLLCAGTFEQIWFVRFCRHSADSRGVSPSVVSSKHAGGEHTVISQLGANSILNWGCGGVVAGRDKEQI